MARDAKVLRVTLEALTCTRSEGDEIGGTDALEIRGWQEARGVFIDGSGDPQAGFKKEMWRRTKDEGPIAIGPGAEIPINTSTEFLVFEHDFLWLGGVIVDEDSGPFDDDDILGEGFMRIGYPNINSGIVNVGFNKDEQEILARYRVKVLRVEHHPEA